MGGALSSCCCGPTIREEKRIVIHAAWEGLFANTLGAKWLTKIETKTRSGKTKVTTWRRDAASGAETVEVVTEDGYFDPATTTVVTYEDAYTVADYMTFWRGVLDDFAPLNTYRGENLIDVLLPDGGGGWETTETTITLDWWSVLTEEGTVTAPDNSFNGVVLVPDPSESPWNGKFRLLSGECYEEVGNAPGLYLNNYDFGGYFLTGKLAAATPLTGRVIQTCQAYPFGLGCDAAVYGDQFNVVISCDTAAGTQTADWDLKLSPGWYSFDSLVLQVHSGERLAGSGIVQSGTVGTVERGQYFDPPTLLDWNDEVCP